MTYTQSDIETGLLAHLELIDPKKVPKNIRIRQQTGSLNWIISHDDEQVILDLAKQGKILIDRQACYAKRIINRCSNCCSSSHAYYECKEPSRCYNCGSTNCHTSKCDQDTKCFICLGPHKAIHCEITEQRIIIERPQERPQERAITKATGAAPAPVPYNLSLHAMAKEVAELKEMMEQQNERHQADIQKILAAIQSK